MNTPTFGNGKLNDGNIVCLDCFKKIGEVSPSIVRKLKNHSSAEIKDLLEQKGMDNSRIMEIKAQIDALNLGKLSAYIIKNKIQELASALMRDESIDYIVEGLYKGISGILVSTNQRILVIGRDKENVFNKTVESFPLNGIVSIQLENAFSSGKIIIKRMVDSIVIDSVLTEHARMFSEIVNTKLLGINNSGTNQNNASESVLDQIEKLSDLKNKGIITEKEFEEQKEKLLRKL